MLSDTQIRLLAEAEAAGRNLPAQGKGSVDRQLLGALADCGMLARLYPTEGVSATDLCLIRQGLARTNTEAETAFAMQGLGSYPIYQSGSQEAVDRWIPAISSGRAVPAFALTEPEAGSDAGAIALSAEADGDGWRLSGRKAWISNAPEADVYVVFARTDPEGGSRGVSAFVVPGTSQGLTGESVTMISPHPIGHLEFDGVRVDRTQLLGEENHGFRVAMATLDLFRPSVGAFAVGMAEQALEIARAHAVEREAFGKPIYEFQAISHRLADMATEIAAARLLVYEAAATYDRGDRSSLTTIAAMAKLTATETAQRVVDRAVQIVGARALEATHPLAHLYRDVRAPRIYEGTSEIQRNIIARSIRDGSM